MASRVVPAAFVLRVKPTWFELYVAAFCSGVWIPVAVEAQIAVRFATKVSSGNLIDVVVVPPLTLRTAFTIFLPSAVSPTNVIVDAPCVKVPERLLYNEIHAFAILWCQRCHRGVLNYL